MVKDLNVQSEGEEFKSSCLQPKYNLGVQPMCVALSLEFLKLCELSYVWYTKRAIGQNAKKDFNPRSYSKTNSNFKSICPKNIPH